MGYKFAFMLSLIFVVQIMLLGGDIVNVQAIYGQLDALSMSVNQLIARQGKITTSVEELVASYDAEINCVPGYCMTLFGSTYKYEITKAYTPLIMAKESMTIKVSRAVVIGYYN